MKKLEYIVSFTTPAFLGNAEQSGQWRTPPFKALLRHWWRVAYAADHRFNVDVAQMRREEGLLFGHAWLKDDSFERNGRRETTAARKSLVRMRLNRWDEGKLNTWDKREAGAVHHPEAEKANYRVGPHAYLGYGPLDGRGGTKFARKGNAAIQAGEAAELSLAVPATHKDAAIRRLLETNTPRIERALWLMDRYGTLGGRSRNGWGSFALLPSPAGGEAGGEGLPLRVWHDCLQFDWPHAIGQDINGSLIWTTTPHADWKALMKTLAIVKIGLRTQFVFPNAQPPHQQALPRHWLSYPITRHTTRAFDRNARLPNSLRFKVRATDNGKLVGVIFHVPCLPPAAFAPNPTAIIATWQRVHGLLDELAQPAAVRRHASITDPARRNALKPGLDGVSLQRIPE